MVLSKIPEACGREMNYKDTLNLPQTDFPMKADLVKREPDRFAMWEKTGLYKRILNGRDGCPRFVLHDGPPFANGDVHIGTALNKILKDIIVRVKTLFGFYAPYVPGWDCHGLPIEFKVVQELTQKGTHRADPLAIRRACREYALKYVEIQRKQFKRLGVLGDWENAYLTLSPEYEAEELRFFAGLVEKGFVYRGKKPVYWSIPCRTALAEAEVEYKDHVSPSIYVKFPVVGMPDTYVLIWTTTPWTLPANLAVAYNSTFQYVKVTVGIEKYIMYSGLVESVASKCSWKHYKVEPLETDTLEKIEYKHPFCERTGRLYPGDEFVESSTGTGLVHIAPGHGLEDYELGCRVGLPIYSPIDDDGRFIYTDDLPQDAQMPESFLGKSVLEVNGKSEANEVVLNELRRRALLLNAEEYLHSYPHCWRSKTPVIFRAMHQWFIKIDHPINVEGRMVTLRELALEEIGRVNWIPAWGQNRIEAAVRSRPDWCISRQRSWGVPLPVFYDSNRNPILDAEIIRRVADLIEAHGSDIWFEKSVNELWALVRPPAWAGADPVEKSSDTLDVWIDSGVSWRAVVARRPELRGDPKPFQSDLYIEGSDQHRGWFQSSMLLALAGEGAAPFKTVLTHGFLVDADREKISKSAQAQGMYDKPQTAEAYVNKWGADIIRLWVASQDFRADIVVSEERIAKVAESYRVIRNALRFQLSNLYDFDPAIHTVPYEQLNGLDRWILGRFSALEAQIRKAYEEYEFHEVYQRLIQFVAVDLSAIYHDIIKDRLYTLAPNAIQRRAAQTVLWQILVGMCHMLAPILVFTAEEAWERIPGRPAETVHMSRWIPTNYPKCPTGEFLEEIRQKTLPKLEEKRQAKLIGKSLEAKVIIRCSGSTYDTLKANEADLLERLCVSQVEVVRVDGHPDLQIEVVHAEGKRCERCWRWTTDVGTFAEHPTICGRCRATLEEITKRSGS